MQKVDQIDPIEEICRDFESGVHKGLSEDKAGTKLKKYGLNKLTGLKPCSWHETFLKTISRVFSPLLFLIAVLCILSYWFTLSALTKLIVIFVLVFIFTLTTYFTYYKQSESSAIIKK
jgi:magnesium-transporting ATPase (P-type)